MRKRIPPVRTIMTMIAISRGLGIVFMPVKLRKKGIPENDFTLLGE